MSEIIYKITTNDDIELLMSSRLEMLKVVNDLPQDHVYSDELVSCSRDYFLNGDHITVLAMDGGEVIGCASMSFMWIMPTYSHPMYESMGFTASSEGMTLTR